jgi:RNase P subunit RPR2
MGETNEMASQAYCVKCKTKREMKDATQITMKNGRPATEGKCPECGTKMFKIGAAT